jgi:O-acetyl-ADP-ribose deacetylase (regulator of RNase III)
MERMMGTTKLVAIQGDLTAQDVDAIVNAANDYLQHGGGVAAAIVRAGGFEIQQESDAWVHEHGPVGRGTAAVTTAGAMPARWVVHTVGPRFREGQDNEGLLIDAVTSAIEAGIEVGARSMAFPAISAGIFGYPPDEAAKVIVAAAAAFAASHPGALDEIRFVAFDQDMANRFRNALAR